MGTAEPVNIGLVNSRVSIHRRIYILGDSSSARLKQCFPFEFIVGNLDGRMFKGKIRLSEALTFSF
jgi:hypothetical protein